MFTYACLSEVARVFPQVAFSSNVSGFAYSNPQPDLLCKVLSVQVLSLPLLSPSWVTASHMNSEISTENMRIHWSWHLAQGKRFFNKGTSRHVRGHFPIDLGQSPMTWQRGLMSWLYQSSAISDSNAYRHSVSLETCTWLRDWVSLKVVFVLISELLVLIPIFKIFCISKLDF